MRWKLQGVGCYFPRDETFKFRRGFPRSVRKETHLTVWFQVTNITCCQWESLIRVVYASMSLPIFGWLTRPDMGHVTMLEERSKVVESHGIICYISPTSTRKCSLSWTFLLSTQRRTTLLLTQLWPIFDVLWAKLPDSCRSCSMHLGDGSAKCRCWEYGDIVQLIVEIRNFPMENETFFPG